MKHAPQESGTTYYDATARPSFIAPALQGSVEADICVVGGGMTGLSAALHAAGRGMSVVLVEAGRIGGGASGRNGGQLIPHQRKGAAELIQMYGEATARELVILAELANDTLLEIIERNSIDCDLKRTGHLSAAYRRTDLAWMQDEIRALERLRQEPGMRLLDRAALGDEIASRLYHGGLLDERGGHMHPLAYTYGLARAARAAGVRIFETTPAISIEQGARVVIQTPEGKIRARHVVMAADALLGTLMPALARRMMPIASHMVATEPLGARAAELLPHDRAVSDSRFVTNYFRLSADGRLLFGGGERYRRSAPADIGSFVRPHMLRVFPQLEDVHIEFAWRGLVGITLNRMPHFGRLGEIWFAHGYSGHGALLATFAGKLIAEAMTGTIERFDVFSRIPPQPFPGGRMLRHPLRVAGMFYYAMRDRL